MVYGCYNYRRKDGNFQGAKPHKMSRLHEKVFCPKDFRKRVYLWQKNSETGKTAQEYIQENYRRDLSLDELSKELDISPYYFSKLFKEETGSNFVEYLTNLRMSRAKELLKDERCSMKEICLEVGYSDPNYFSRIFKKNFGVTPTEYREREKV